MVRRTSERLKSHRRARCPRPDGAAWCVARGVAQEAARTIETAFRELKTAQANT
jgi:hypothetical protein